MLEMTSVGVEEGQFEGGVRGSLAAYRDRERPESGK